MGKLFRIMDMAAFEVELQHFWETPEKASPGWMAQLLLVMSLGCDSLNTMDGHFAASHGHLPNQFLDQAAVLLHQTPFMFRPDVGTIQTLCLMVLAKLMIRKSCFEEDASWCLTGMIKRLAMSINLHLDQPGIPSTYLESGVRRGLWTTILYLDLHLSVLSGLPSLAEPLRTSSAPSGGLGFGDGPHRLPDDSTPRTTSHASYGEEVYQTVFSRVLPLAHEVALAARSIDLPYETAVRLDENVRKVLREVRELSAESASPARACHDDYLVLPWEATTYLDTLFRRLLLELHRRFAYEPQAAIHHAVSHWSTLDCAAAMLVLQRSICEKSESTAGQWLIGIFRSDFFVAGLTVSVYLIQNSSQLDSPTLPGGYALKTLLDTLRSCRDLWARGKNVWPCEFQKFRFFDQVIASLDQCTVVSHAYRNSH
ncbi:putative C6 transcription factor [Cladophialophora carrionii]|uniref:Putative C6 transcription factor n=1 Tax=Cladophialophora carrionii TaxID=86049 RepID=A0A1C1C859_9EURO|nr:putative C6 transcription factor [Cladophialophora carrionii]